MEACTLNNLLCYHTENDVSKVKGRCLIKNENYAQNNEALRER